MTESHFTGASISKWKALARLQHNMEAAAEELQQEALFLLFRRGRQRRECLIAHASQQHMPSKTVSRLKNQNKNSRAGIFVSPNIWSQNAIGKGVCLTGKMKWPQYSTISKLNIGLK